MHADDQRAFFVGGGGGGLMEQSRNSRGIHVATGRSSMSCRRRWGQIT